jgi:hypothetical protein
MSILAAAIAAFVAVAFVVNGVRGVAARRSSSRNRRAGTAGPAARPSD